jgi:predicted nucleic acid-binding protein
VPEIGSDRAAGLATYRLAAPDLLDAECANVLSVKVTRAEISEADALTRIARLIAAPVERIPCRELASAALKLSRIAAAPNRCRLWGGGGAECNG